MPVAERKPWSDDENEAVVAAYFDMLDDELAGQPYNKAAVLRSLIAGALSGRSNGSIEFKFQNISAVLDDYQLDWIDGYKPRRNYQSDLEAAVVSLAQARGLNPVRKTR